jgi:hypothetical protein
MTLRQLVAAVTVRPRRASWAALVMAPWLSGRARSFCSSRGWASAASPAPLRAQRGARRGARPREEIALADRQAQAAQHVQVRLLLQAFGDDLATAGGGHFDDGAHELLFQRLLRNAVDEMAVDLDEVGPHLHPAAQRREALAEVVQRDTEAPLAQRLQRVVESGHVLDRPRLGQLDDDARGRQAQLGQLRGQPAGMLTRAEQRVGGDVDEELPRQAQGLEALDGAPHDEMFQLDEAAQPGGGFEQHQGRMQWPVGRRAGQRLEAIDLGAVDGDQGLEVKVETALLDEAIEGVGKGIGRGRAHGRLRVGAPARDIRAGWRRGFLKHLVTVR